MGISLDNISKSFGSAKVLDGLSLSFAEGKTTCMMGPSGCGKTAVLDILAGIAEPDGGRVIGLENRRIAYVFQEPRLLPWKNVLQNVEFVLPEAMPAPQRLEKAMACLETVELSEDISKFPAQLSCGMAQRTSLARALAFDADVVLLDEPFSGLDRELKERIASRLNLLWSGRSTTVILVTHAEEEAALFGAEIVRWNE